MKFPFFRLQVQGSSMLPTFSPGQFIISFNWFLKLKEGDLIILKINNKLMAKRLQKIRGHEVFVVGDNLKASTDSRKFGWLKKDQIVGKVVYIFDGR